MIAEGVAPEQIVWFPGILTVVVGVTVKVTVPVPLHPLLSVTVTVYAVVLPGLAVGFCAVLELKLVFGDQE